MRAERRGGPPNLQRAFRQFVIQSLHGRSLDDSRNVEAKLGKFPDFGCFRDIVLIEMKHLEADQKDRLNEAYQKHVKPDEHPMYYGTRPMDFAKLSNGEDIKAALLNKLSQTIETQLRRANRQFESYRSRNPRKNFVNVCVFLNSQLDEFNPQVVLHSVHRKMKGAGEPRFPHIDAVIYITEKHFEILPDGRMAFAIGIFEGFGLIQAGWKTGFVDLLVRRWSEFRTGEAPAERAFDARDFNTIEDIPDRMSRSDAWRLAYKRHPYLRSLTVQELKVHFNRCSALNARAFLIGSWPKPPPEETAIGLQRFTDALEEINARGLDMRDFDPRLLSTEELRTVYQDLPAELVALLTRSGR